MQQGKILLPDWISALCASTAQHGGKRGFWNGGTWVHGVSVWSQRGDQRSDQVSTLTHLSTLSFTRLHASMSQFLSDDRLHYRSQRTRELDSLLGDLHCDIRGLLISLTKQFSGFCSAKSKSLASQTWRRQWWRSCRVPSWKGAVLCIRLVGVIQNSRFQGFQNDSHCDKTVVGISVKLLMHVGGLCCD